MQKKILFILLNLCVGCSCRYTDSVLDDPRITIGVFPPASYHETRPPRAEVKVGASDGPQQSVIVGPFRRHQPEKDIVFDVEVENQIGKPIVSPGTAYPPAPRATSNPSADSQAHLRVGAANKLVLNNSPQLHTGTITSSSANDETRQTSMSVSHHEQQQSISDSKKRCHTGPAQIALAGSPYDWDPSKCTIHDLSISIFSQMEMEIRSKTHETCYRLGINAYIEGSTWTFQLRHFKPRPSASCLEPNDTIIIDADCGYLTMVLRKTQKILILDHISFTASGPNVSTTEIFTTERTMRPILMTPLGSNFECYTTTTIQGERYGSELVIEYIRLEAIAPYHTAEAVTFCDPNSGYNANIIQLNHQSMEASAVHPPNFAQNSQNPMYIMGTITFGMFTFTTISITIFLATASSRLSCSLQ